jgi:hypothetical protein
VSSGPPMSYPLTTLASRASPRRHWTIQGKVVYERPTHYFEDNDVVRVLRSRLRIHSGNPVDIIRRLLALILDVGIAYIQERGADLDVATRQIAGVVLELTVHRLIDAAIDLYTYLWEHLRGWLGAGPPT